ncbi:MAG: Uma2 family endonuclease [Planctomycetota bacterium]
MSDPSLQSRSLKLTASEFAMQRPDLPEAGRWHELHEGRLVLLSAPEEIHGTIVLNLSRMLAVWLQSQPPDHRGYACHGLGLHVESAPDTLYFPAISLFLGNSSFLQADRMVASAVPDLVIDIASTNDRRSDMRRRTTACLQHGVPAVWVPDPFKKEIQVIRRGAHTLALGHWQMLDGSPQLPGFSVPVEQVFAQPKWWDGRVPECRVVTEPPDATA